MGVSVLFNFLSSNFLSLIFLYENMDFPYVIVQGVKTRIVHNFLIPTILALGLDCWLSCIESTDYLDPWFFFFIVSILSQNHFSGTIPKEFGGLAMLEVLDLRNNSLNGTIPVELQGIHSLRHLWVHCHV